MATLNLQTKKSFSEQNMRKIISILTGLMSSVSTLEDQCIKEYDNTGNTTYQKGQIVVGSDGYFYEAKTVASGVFDSSKWTKIGTDSFEELDLDTIKSYLNLSQDELDNLQNLIDDTTITTTKTNSSSKIYMDIQAAIAECKDDTLKQIAKKVSGSYKIATSTAEVTSADYIYLISNGSNYDLYVLVEGNPTKVGDTSIDLSDYAKLTDLDNYYNKTTSDGKFATITTVDGKVDKTSIATAISNTATDEQVYSASVMNTELDKKLGKTDMSTIIDSTSTDDTVPTNKSVYDNAIANKRLKTYAIAAGADFPDLKTLQDIANNLPSNSIALIDSAHDSTSFFGLPSNKFTIVWMRRYAGRDSIMAYTPTGLSYICTNISKQTWKRVCTTSVDDVDNTAIESKDSNITINSGRSYYYVKNGICYVSVWDFKGTETCQGLVIKSDMPKTTKQPAGAPAIASLSTGGIMGQVYIRDNSTELRVNIYTTGVMGFCNFSYPVAES